MVIIYNEFFYLTELQHCSKYLQYIRFKPRKHEHNQICLGSYSSWLKLHQPIDVQLKTNQNTIILIMSANIALLTRPPCHAKLTSDMFVEIWLEGPSASALYDIKVQN